MFFMHFGQEAYRFLGSIQNQYQSPADVPDAAPYRIGICTGKWIAIRMMGRFSHSHIRIVFEWVVFSDVSRGMGATQCIGVVKLAIPVIPPRPCRRYPETRRFCD